MKVSNKPSLPVGRAMVCACGITHYSFSLFGRTEYRAWHCTTCDDHHVATWRPWVRAARLRVVRKRAASAR